MAIVDEIDNPVRGDHLTDDQAMRLAMQEARKGLGFVSPNPPVGCVILDSHNRFLSKGHHEKFGGSHAEVMALQGVAEADLQGARVFVTLEPCAHQGKTPSCAKALARLPLREVIYGLVDPNPLVQGQGAGILQAAGLTTTLFGKWYDGLEEICEHFLVNFRENRPFVSLKVAASLDGQMALKNGESHWITGELAREYAHELRATHDAILVGRKTILQDDPKLNIRHARFPGKRNKVVILDSRGGTLSSSQLQVFRTHHPNDIFVFSADPGLKSDLAQVQAVSSTSTGLNLTEILHSLWGQGARSVLVEGGARVLSSFINGGLADRLYLFQAPTILGAQSGKSWTESVKIDSLSQKIFIKNQIVRSLGRDILLTGKF